MSPHAHIRAPSAQPGTRRRPCRRAGAAPLAAACLTTPLLVLLAPPAQAQPFDAGAAMLFAAGAVPTLLATVLAVALGLSLQRRRRLNRDVDRLQETLERLSNRVTTLTDENAALQESVRQYCDLVEWQPGLLLCRDAEDRVTFANATLCQLLGLDEREIQGRPFEGAADPRQEPTIAAARARLFMRPHRVTYEQRLLTKNGWRWVTWHEVARLDAAGRVVERRAIGHDITRYKAAAEALQGDRDRALAENAARARLLAAVSHDIRTPITGIVGMAQLLLDDGLTDEQRRQVLAIGESGDSLLQLVNDVLDAAKLEAGRLSLEEQGFDPRDVVDSVLALLQPRARQKRLSFGATVEPAVPRQLDGDPDRLRQILLNLASNAIKFTQTGEVTIVVSTVSTNVGGVTLLFEVTDTGCGIAADEQDRLFEAFTQGAGDDAQRREGSGLGLTIAEGLVRLMGGQIGVESTPGTGSTFWFVVELALPHGQAEAGAGEAAEAPQAPDVAATAAPAQPASGTTTLVDGELLQRLVAEQPGDGLNVLLAEDNSVNQLLALTLIRRLGAKADIAANGEEALHALDGGDYDLVLMDLHMPGMDGLEATRRIRALNSPKADVPIVALTDAVAEYDARRCQDAGMDGYLAKPLGIEELANLLRSNRARLTNGQRKAGTP